MGKKTDELKSAEHELRKEISQRKQEIKTLKDDVENTVRQNHLIAEELESANEQINTSRVHVAYCRWLTDRLLIDWLLDWLE